MLCPNCESENRDEAKFCDQCGFPLATDADEVDPDDSSSKAPEGEESDSQEPKEAEGLEDTAAASSDATVALGAKPDTAATVALEADLAGFEVEAEDYGERVVSPGYQAPDPVYRDGGTMQMPRVEGEEAPKRRDYLASATTEQRKHGKAVAIAVAVVAVLGVTIAFATFQLGVWGGKVVPDVVGMTEADARSVLSDSGFVVRSEQVKSDDTEGLVLIEDPSAGQRAEEGAEVVIHLAAARTIPEIVGMSRAEAEAALAEAGYENVSFSEKSSDKKKGTVLSVSPQEGDRAKSTAKVEVKLAKPYTVPDVSGKGVDDAIKAIEKAGLGYEVVYYDTTDYPEGTAVNTDPAAGSEVKKGAYVVINVAQARGSKLEELVREQIGQGATLESGGANYIVETLDSVAYLGNNTVSYTATAHEYMYVFGSTIQNPTAESISGTVVFDENDQIVAIS